ncbi:hypothetical protein L3N51_01335 [Metallosphaera sp. J1]|uniref:hypothetical protein n=1 Tax=Metallosphaera TaxID=41980 RepID=UPI001EDFCB21|nr:hypothetical protein [Metallosphaera javensis (ex Hofmann et al. 2022)]MCG3109045.1 hypothetical protein [Metallosphaera javensis (ex Hofmann et al. 2022)]
MSNISSINGPLRYLGGALMVIWAIIHFFLSTELLKRLPLVGEFFIVDSVLMIIGAVVLFVGFRLLYLPVLVLDWANYLLLTESRIYPAPVLGFPLPAINSYVIGTFVLDIVTVIVVTLVYITVKKK